MELRLNYVIDDKGKNLDDIWKGTHSKCKDISIPSWNAETTSETEVKSDLEFRPAAKQANRAHLTFPQGFGTPRRERKCLVRGPNTMHELYRDRRPRGRDPQTLTQWSVPQRLQTLHKDPLP